MNYSKKKKNKSINYEPYHYDVWEVQLIPKIIITFEWEERCVELKQTIPEWTIIIITSIIIIKLLKNAERYQGKRIEKKTFPFFHTFKIRNPYQIETSKGFCCLLDRKNETNLCQDPRAKVWEKKIFFRLDDWNLTNESSRDFPSTINLRALIDWSIRKSIFSSRSLSF